MDKKGLCAAPTSTHERAKEEDPDSVFLQSIQGYLDDREEMITSDPQDKLESRQRLSVPAVHPVLPQQDSWREVVICVSVH
ncbi:hypothetical protein ABVT39_004151 [Epinephelus coioides]